MIYNMIKELDDYFSYRYISEFEELDIKRNWNNLSKKFSKLTKSWDENLNSEWVLRDYMAVKMILSASVLLSSCEFSKEKNIRIVEPYLNYYALLSCCRAVIFTSPDCAWNNKELFEMTHKKTINIIGDIISKFNKERGIEIKEKIDKAREYREIYSYKFPANGLIKDGLSLKETINICSLLCEIAQFQSKVLENSVTKNVSMEYEFDADILSMGFWYGDKHFNFTDSEDMFRIGYMVRKQKRPYSLHMTMTEGMVEDFFGAWYPENDSDLENTYNPDANWQIIFPVP